MEENRKPNAVEYKCLNGECDDRRNQMYSKEEGSKWNEGSGLPDLKLWAGKSKNRYRECKNAEKAAYIKEGRIVIARNYNQV